MNSTESAVALKPYSPLGTVEGGSARTLVEHAEIRISEEPFLHLSSVRLSRTGDPAAIKALLPLSLGQLPNTFSGDADHAIARYEPRAWIVISRQPIQLPTDVAGCLVTDLSARLACFRISGTGAAKILASSTSVAPALGGFVRTIFAENYAVLLQRLGEQDYRLLVDAGLAQSCADWLLDTAPQIQSS
jgi:heterotetrameric sarcosine oxidase gamma subunit